PLHVRKDMQESQQSKIHDEQIVLVEDQKLGQLGSNSKRKS
ncbi:36359_t:CDS:2, partial [Gigaspora margarita]